MENSAGAIPEYNDFINKLKDFTARKDQDGIHETVIDYKTGSCAGEEGATIFFCEVRMRETILLAYIIPIRRTLYKTRRIIIRPDQSEVRISLHEIFQRPEEEGESKKRKFRFYVKSFDLNHAFLMQCEKYLLHRISNHDVIKSVPHVKASGMGL